jgi:hypothetical protein
MFVFLLGCTPPFAWPARLGFLRQQQPGEVFLSRIVAPAGGVCDRKPLSCIGLMRAAPPLSRVELNSSAVASRAPEAPQLRFACFIVHSIDETRERIAARHIRPAGLN